MDEKNLSAIGTGTAIKVASDGVKDAIFDAPQDVKHPDTVSVAWKENSVPVIVNMANIFKEDVNRIFPVPNPFVTI